MHNNVGAILSTLPIRAPLKISTHVSTVCPGFSVKKWPCSCKHFPLTTVQFPILLMFAPRKSNRWVKRSELHYDSHLCYQTILVCQWDSVKSRVKTVVWKPTSQTTSPMKCRQIVSCTLPYPSSIRSNVAIIQYKFNPTSKHLSLDKNRQRTEGYWPSVGK